MNTLYKQAQALQTQTVKDRRFLHEHAEVGFALEGTKAYVQKRLSQLKIPCKEIGRAGIVAMLGEKKKGGATLLRADMDALPIQERSGESFACQSGCMHACGHDMHTAILLGVASVLKARETELKTPVKLLFQPAEELLQGAYDCVQSGVLNAPKVTRAAALHVAVDVPLPTGTIILPSAGVRAPAADFFSIFVQGKGCHGSAPQNGVDSLLIAAHILLALEEILSREVESSVPSVLTIGKVQGGDTFNAIAQTTVLQGTLRTFDESVRKRMKTRVKSIAQGIAKSFRATAQIDFFGGCPCLVNDAEICENFEKGIGQVFDERYILREKYIQESALKRKSGGSEDFAVIAQEVPSIFFALAAGNTKQGYKQPLHSPNVRFDEKALAYGVAALSAFALL